MKLTTRFDNNLKLLFDDVLASIRKARVKPYQDKENFQIANRKEVLHLYRHMLKHIPPMYERKLERVHLKENIKFQFREGSREQDVEVIKHLKASAYTVIEKINKGVFPPFPKLMV